MDVRSYQALLRAAGLRSTQSRIAVLEYLHTNTGPKSHTELFEALEHHGFDRATIYRILIDLARANILSRIDLGDHVWRFELKKTARGSAMHTMLEHPHFVCTDCGLVACLPGVAIKLADHTRAPKAVRDKLVSIQLQGRCDRCQSS